MLRRSSSGSGRSAAATAPEAASAPPAAGRPDWNQRITALTAVVAVAIALGTLYVTQSANQQQDTSDQLQVKLETQKQVNDRFALATDQLGSDQVDVRVGGMYAFERIMQDSPPDEARVLAVLSTYVRGHATTPPPGTPPAPPTLDVQTALTVLGHHRNAASSSAIDLSYSYLVAAKLQGAQLHGANLRGADLTGAYLQGADLSEADLYAANLAHSYLSGVDIDPKGPQGANLRGADLSEADLTGAYLAGVDLRGANLSRSTVTGAGFGFADLRGADLYGVNLSSASTYRAKLDAGATG